MGTPVELRGSLELAPIWPATVPEAIPVLEAHVVQDEAWAPRIAATVTVPYTAARAAALDPRQAGHRRATVTITRHWMGSQTVAAVTRFLQNAGVVVVSQFSSLTSPTATLGGFTGIFSNDWGAGFRDPDTFTADLTIRARTVDHVASTITVRLASDELIAQEPRVYLTRQVEPLPARILALLEAGGVPVVAHDLSAGDAFIAVPGAAYDRDRSVYEHAAAVAADLGLRLTCDEARVWRLEVPDAAPTSAVHLPRVKTATDDVDRDLDYADAIMWRGRGYREDGTVLLELKTWPATLPDPPFKSFFHEEDYGKVGAALPMPSDGELAARLAALQSKDRKLTLTAVADPLVRAGMAVTTGLPSLPAYTAVASRVEWAIPADTMTITTRSTTED